MARPLKFAEPLPIVEAFRVSEREANGLVALAERRTTQLRGFGGTVTVATLLRSLVQRELEAEGLLEPPQPRPSPPGQALLPGLEVAIAPYKRAPVAARAVPLLGAAPGSAAASGVSPNAAPASSASSATEAEGGAPPLPSDPRPAAAPAPVPPPPETPPDVEPDAGRPITAASVAFDDDAPPPVVVPPPSLAAPGLSSAAQGTGRAAPPPAGRSRSNGSDRPTAKRSAAASKPKPKSRTR